MGPTLACPYYFARLNKFTDHKIFAYTANVRGVGVMSFDVGISIRTTLEIIGDPGDICDTYSGREDGINRDYNTVYVKDLWEEAVYGPQNARIHLQKDGLDRTVMHEFGHVIGLEHPHENNMSHTAPGWAHNELMTQYGAKNRKTKTPIFSRDFSCDFSRKQLQKCPSLYAMKNKEKTKTPMFWRDFPCDFFRNLMKYDEVQRQPLNQEIFLVIFPEICQFSTEAPAPPSFPCQPTPVKR